MPMAAIHNHTDRDKPTDGRIIVAEHMTKIRSARLSIFEPNSFSVPIFLAIGPSIISEMPHQQYSTQNPGLKTGTNRIVRDARPLEADMILGRDFT